MSGGAAGANDKAAATGWYAPDMASFGPLRWASGEPTKGLERYGSRVEKE